MTLVPTRQLMQDAADAGTGQGAFNVIHLETAEGLVAGAELAGLPVILQISQNCVKFHGALEPLALGTLAVARRAAVPVAVHLDHAHDEQLVREAVELGFGSVMYDGAHLNYSDNITATARVTRHAHDRGVYVEAELGEVGGKDGAHAPGVRTDPEEAVTFVAETGVDALAVAVGSSHAMTERTASLDLRLNGVFTRAVRHQLEQNSNLVDSRKYLGPGRTALVPEVARLLALFADAGEAEPTARAGCSPRGSNASLAPGAERRHG